LFQKLGHNMYLGDSPTKSWWRLGWDNDFQP